MIEPLVVSWGYESETPGVSTFQDYMELDRHAGFFCLIYPYLQPLNSNPRMTGIQCVQPATCWLQTRFLNGQRRPCFSSFMLLINGSRKW